MGRPGRGAAGILLGLAISAAALVLALRWAGWGPVLSAFDQANFLYIPPAIAVFLISMLARGMAWRVILGRRTSLIRVLAALNQGYLLNNLLPWRMGEIGRAILLGRRPGLSTSMVLSSIVVERLYDMTLAVGMLLAVGPLALNTPWATQAALIGGLAVAAAAGFLLLVLVRPQVVEAVLRWAPGGQRRWMRAWEGFRAGLQSLQSPGSLLAGFGLLLASWLLAACEYWLELRAFSGEAQFSWAALALSATALGIAVPSAPGYIGVFEAATIAALAVVGVGSGTALAFALVVHGLHLAITSGLGALALAGEGETLVSLARAVRSWATPAAPDQTG